MQLTTEHKGIIAGAIKSDLKRKGGNQTRHATILGINPSVYSRLLKGETERLLSDAQWIRIAIELGLPLENAEWKTALTETFKRITAHLDTCRKKAASLIFVDEKGIGKSYTARQYALKHPNVAYIDCSSICSKNQLIRAIARQFGVNPKGNYQEVRQNLIDNILTFEKPLIILDEAGDLPDSCYGVIKSLWNALEGYCGWYMMGANGLRAKINRKMASHRVGFEEVYDRFGARYQSCIAEKTDAERVMFRRAQAALVLATNRPGLGNKEATELLNRCELSLRRLYLLLNR